MSNCPKCNDKAVFDPPQTVFEDYYHPQKVNVIHQVKVVRRHHCVPFYCHTTTVSVEDVYCGDFEGNNNNNNRGAYTSGLKKKR